MVIDMLLSRIQQDLFDFTDCEDPEDFGSLIEFWYRANTDALATALSGQPGLNLIVNVNSFNNFESLAKRLFLVADTLILRDARDWAQDKAEFGTVLVPIDSYQPGYLPSALDDLRSLQASPLALRYQPHLIWTSDTKELNSGVKAAYAAGGFHHIPDGCKEWIRGSGRDYLRTGQIVYAPFVPPLSMELEFLKEGINLPDSFGASSFFHKNYDWLSEDHLQALLSLEIPFLDGLDIETISKVKEDNQDAFHSFSRTLIDAIGDIKSSYGTEGFVRNVRSIQRNQIDAALSDVTRTVSRIKQSAALRKQGLLAGLLGLNAASILGMPEASLVTGIASGAAALVAERVSQLKERGELQDKKGYFLWRLGALPRSSI